MRRINPLGLKVLAYAGFFMTAGNADASTVISNGYSRFEEINPNGADQLTGWLGKGSLTLTRIFDAWDFYGQNDRAPSPDELDAAVTGMGPTFTVLQTNFNGTNSTAFIGWYNPINGLTPSGGSAGETDMDAFIFNLETDRIFRRNVNRPSITEGDRVSNIGVGRDIRLSNPADRYFIWEGSTRPLNYVYPSGEYLFTDPSRPNTNPLDFQIISLEVFSISVDALAMPAGVPEPATWAMMIVGFGMTGGALRY